MNEDILKPYIRPVTERDRIILPTFSHSKLECFENCNYNYLKKYIKKKVSDDTSIALELGTLCHAVLEYKGKMLLDETNDCVVNFPKLEEMLESGIDEITEKTRSHISGLKEIKRKYWETWSEADASGSTYNDKLNRFMQVLYTEMQEDKWEPFLFEHNFEFVWDNRAIIHGFIDRVDVHGDAFRTVDYKTSRKTYDQSKLATSQQFGIYACALLNEYGKLPSQSLYRFIFLDESQYALTNGWEKRLIKKLTKIFDQIDSCEAAQVWKPKPSPLCYYCNNCKNNPNATTFRNECEYYSLWTPTDRKNFSVNKEWSQEDKLNSNSQSKRAILF